MLILKFDLHDFLHVDDWKYKWPQHFSMIRTWIEEIFMIQDVLLEGIKFSSVKLVFLHKKILLCLFLTILFCFVLFFIFFYLIFYNLIFSYFNLYKLIIFPCFIWGLAAWFVDNIKIMLWEISNLQFDIVKGLNTTRRDLLS